VILPFSFVHTVREPEVRRRAERLEAQAGYLPWHDWTDYVDQVRNELIEEFDAEAERLNMREHRIEKDQSASGHDARFICSFTSETDMVVLKTAIA
jgi:hypothetical protein